MIEAQKRFWQTQRLVDKGIPEQVHNRHSGESRNPVKSSIWIPGQARNDNL
jgi:hypothetical protein